MPDVFLSYNREDRSRAQIFAEGLEAEGLAVWWDTALRAGENYDEVTERNLREASAVVVLWSKRSVQSKWVRAEATLGQRKSALVPAMIEDCDRPLVFELVQAADLVRWNGDRSDVEWRGFIEVIKSRVKTGSKAAEPSSQARSSASAEAASKTKHLEAATALHAATIETTFWQSIKDSRDPTEFEAYLERYPAGHFAALARNRIIALKPAKPAAPPPRPQSAPPVQAKTPPTDNPKPQMRTPAPAPKAPPPPPPRRPAPVARQSGGMNAGLIAVIAVVVLAAAGGGAYWFLGRGAPPKNKVAEVPASTTPAASVPSPALAEAAPPPVQDAAAAEPTVPTSASGPPLVVADAAGAAGASTAPAAPGPTESLVGSTASGTAKSTATARDCANCPEMASIPGGTFQMGSPKDEPGRYGYEGPQHEVTIRPFSLSKHEVTFDEWAACTADGGCNGYTPPDRGWGKGKHPVIGISWNDTIAYVQWLSKKTGHTYRLPTEAEWEYAARAGTSTAYWWGANFDASRVSKGVPSEVGSFTANAFGLYDMLGNAAEWVEDCYASNYVGAPADGTASLGGDCTRRVIRGGSFRSSPGDLRAANRGRIDRSTRVGYLGFRVAMTP